MRLVLAEGGGKGEVFMLEVTKRMCYYITLQRGCPPQIVFNPASDIVALNCFHQ